MRRRIMQLHISVVGILFVTIVVSCSSARDKVADKPEKESSSDPAIAEKTEYNCSANLIYAIAVDDPPNYSGLSQDVIPLKCGVAPDDAEGQLVFGSGPEKPTSLHPLHGSSDDGSFSVKVAGLDAGVICHLRFDLTVRYKVTGVYYPYPKCAFGVRVTAEVIGVPSRETNCTVPPGFLQQYPADLLFIPPPDKLYEIPGGPETRVIEKFGPFHELELRLSQIVVPEASKCQWGH